MSDTNGFDPFERPTPYEVLGVKKGIRATAKDIGKAYNKQKREARRLSDVKERAARMEALDRAKEQLQRPENRVLVDFFHLGNDVFADLSCDLGKRLGEVQLPTEKVVGPLLPKVRYDNLMPSTFDPFLGEFELEQEPRWHAEMDDDESQLALINMDA